MARYALSFALAAATLGCGVAHAPERSEVSQSGELESASTCPAVAAACPAGCFTVGAHPVDRSNRCLLPKRNFGCSSVDVVGPPAVVCTAAHDGMVWISFEARRYPRGRSCNGAEAEALRYPRCP
jgi:hypothetical protein